MRESDHQHTDEVVCPYCGYEHSDSWEFDDSDDEFQCRSCDQIFSFERNITVTYSSAKKACDDDKHDFQPDPDCPRFLKKEEYKKVDGQWQWVPLPPEQHHWVNVFKCVNCDESEFVHENPEAPSL